GPSREGRRGGQGREGPGRRQGRQTGCAGPGRPQRPLLDERFVSLPHPGPRRGVLSLLSLPAGPYLVTSSQVAPAEGGAADLCCEMAVGGVAGLTIFYPRLGAGGLASTLVGQASVSLPSGGTVLTACTSSEHQVLVPEPRLEAVRVGAIH